MAKQLCKGEDCFKEVDKEDIVMRHDGTPHRLSLLCEDCITPAQRRSLKRYKKRMRYNANKAKLKAAPSPVEKK